MSLLPYKPKEELCKHGNVHLYGSLCGQCREDLERSELTRLTKKEHRRHLFANVLWPEETK